MVIKTYLPPFPACIIFPILKGLKKCIRTQIQVHSLQILQDLSVKELWSSRVLAHPQILSIVKVKCKYQSLNKLESISSVRFYQAVMYFD